MTQTSRAARNTQRSWLQAYSDYSHYRPRPAEAMGWWRHETTHREPTAARVPFQPQVIDQVIDPAWPLGWGTGRDGVIIDHGRRVVIDPRRNVNAEPKLIVELGAEEKDIIIQCRCGDRISLVQLLGIEAVKPIFDGISGRIRGLIENMKPEAASSAT